HGDAIGRAQPVGMQLQFVGELFVQDEELRRRHGGGRPGHTELRQLVGERVLEDTDVGRRLCHELARIAAMSLPKSETNGQASSSPGFGTCSNNALRPGRFAQLQAEYAWRL